MGLAESRLVHAHVGACLLVVRNSTPDDLWLSQVRARPGITESIGGRFLPRDAISLHSMQYLFMDRPLVLPRPAAIAVSPGKIGAVHSGCFSCFLGNVSRSAPFQLQSISTVDIDKT